MSMKNAQVLRRAGEVLARHNELPVMPSGSLTYARMLRDDLYGALTTRFSEAAGRVPDGYADLLHLYLEAEALESVFEQTVVDTSARSESDAGIRDLAFAIVDLEGRSVMFNFSDHAVMPRAVMAARMTALRSFARAARHIAAAQSVALADHDRKLIHDFVIVLAAEARGDVDAASYTRLREIAGLIAARHTKTADIDPFGDPFADN